MSLKEFMIVGGVHLWTGVAVGFVIGWVFFKRPQWAQNLIDNVKAKIGLG